MAASMYREPAKEIGGRLLRNPILIKTQDVDHKKVTKMACKMADTRPGLFIYPEKNRLFTHHGDVGLREHWEDFLCAPTFDLTGRYPLLQSQSVIQPDFYLYEPAHPPYLHFPR